MLASVYTLGFKSDINVPEEIIGQNKKMDEATNFVKQVASFNCSKIGKHINEVSIEFCFEIPNINTINFVKNRTSLISSVTFLNDTPNLLAVFTDLSFDVYKYKKYRNYENGKEIFVSISEKQKHIIYNSTNVSLFINRDSAATLPVVLFMNIFESGQKLSGNDKELTFVESGNDKELTFVEDKPGKIEIKNRLNFDFYENLLYQKNNDCLKFIWMILDEETQSKNLGFTDIFDINAENTIMLKNKYGNIIQDIIEMDKFNFKLNRFYQRFQLKNALPQKICKWFVDETEKYADVNGWETNNFKKHITTDIAMSNLENIHNYFLKYELKNIIDIIEKSYCLPNETKYNIISLNIIKYSNEIKSGLERHTDSSFITFNISLNSISEYDGGGIYFDDGLTFKNDIGDLLIHCGKMDHIGLPVKKGVRYILVGFINITYEV